MSLAVFEQVNRPHQIMLDHLAAARCAINTGEDARVRCCVDDPIGPWQSIDVAGSAKVRVMQLDMKIVQREPVHLAAAPDEVIATEDFCSFEALTNGKSQRAAGESANTGD